MSEANPNVEVEVSNDPSGPVITTKHETTEVLDSNGKGISGGDSALSKIFDKISEGSDAKSAVKEVMAKKVATTPEPAVKTDTPVETPKEEVIEPVKEKLFEDKPAAKPAAKPVVKDEEKTADEELTDADLQIQPHDRPKTAARIAALLKRSAQAQEMAEGTKKEVALKEQRVKELEEQLNKIKSSDPMTDEKVKTHLDELAMYRRRYELENSDEVKQKFDGRVESAEQEIQKSLLFHGAPNALVEEIKSEGGWIKFIDSERTIALANGKEMTAAEIAETIKSGLPVSERRRLEALELEQIQASRDKQNYFQTETKRAKEYFAEKENQTKAQSEAQKKAFEEATKVVGDWKKKFAEDNEWLREKQLSANLKPEEKAALEDHNKHAKQLNQLLEKHLAAKDINEMLEVLVDSIKYHQERRNLASALSENEKLKSSLKAKQDELDRFKRAGSAVPRSGSIASGSNTPTGEDATKEKAPPSLEDAFAALEAGKTLET